MPLHLDNATFTPFVGQKKVEKPSKWGKPLPTYDAIPVPIQCVCIHQHLLSSHVESARPCCWLPTKSCSFWFVDEVHDR